MPGDKRCDIMTVLAGVSLARAWYKVRPEEWRGAEITHGLEKR